MMIEAMASFVYSFPIHESAFQVIALDINRWRKDSLYESFIRNTQENQEKSRNTERRIRKSTRKVHLDICRLPVDEEEVADDES
mgnify:CR=1 FL=1